MFDFQRRSICVVFVNCSNDFKYLGQSSYIRKKTKFVNYVREFQNETNSYMKLIAICHIVNTVKSRCR